jgi:ribosome-binding protein aMBF1 (putative translation factor)
MSKILSKRRRKKMFESPITKFRAERLHRGWSQQQLDVIAEVGASDVSRIETRRIMPYPDQARKIARVLGMQPRDLQQDANLEDVE